MPPELNFKLTMEQEFNLKVLQQQIALLSLEQCQKLLAESIQQGMVKDNVIRQLMKGG